MRKSLVKYILGSEKNKSTFEPRLAEILSVNMESENALECLIYGIPVKIGNINKEATKSRILKIFSDPSKYRIEDILAVSITSEKLIRIEYQFAQKRYFTTEEEANDAEKAHKRYNGSADRSEKYNIERWITGLQEYTTFPTSEVENCIQVIRE